MIVGEIIKVRKWTQPLFRPKTILKKVHNDNGDMAVQKKKKNVTGATNLLTLS